MIHLMISLRQSVISFTRKSLEEHHAAAATMDEERKALEEALAKSLEEKRRLEVQRGEQHQLLAEHFKKKVSIEDPSTGENESESFAIFFLRKQQIFLSQFAPSGLFHVLRLSHFLRREGHSIFSAT